MAPQPAAPAPYPANLSVDYPDRDLNRLTTAFRIFTAIPILIVAALLTSGGWHWSMALGAGGITFFPTLLMIVFRQKYPAPVVRLEPRGHALPEPNQRLPRVDGRPLSVDRREAKCLARLPLPRRRARGLFEFVEGVIRWETRVVAYAFVLVTDQYPPFRLNP